MSMMMTDSNTAYSENFFTLDNGRVINNFTGRTVGIFVRKIESTNYLLKELKPSLFKRIVNWWRNGDREAYKRVHAIPESSNGGLVETFRLLERDLKDGK